MQINYRRLCKEKKFLKTLGEKSPSILKRLGKGGGGVEQNQQLPQSHRSPSFTSSTLSSFHQLSLSNSPGSGEGVISVRQGSSLSLNSMSPESNGRSQSSFSYNSPTVGKRSPQLTAQDSLQPERSRSLSPIATEDLYSYRRSPLPKHRMSPSISLSTPGSTGLTSQAGLASQHQQKALTNGHSHAHPGSSNYAQSSQMSKCHISLQRRTTEISSMELAQANHGSNSRTLASSARLAGSLQSVDQSPSSSPELAEQCTSRTSKHTRRKHKNSALLTKQHQFSSSPNFFKASNDSLVSCSVNGSSAGGGVSMMKLYDRHDSTLSLLSVTSTTASTVEGDESTKQEMAVMDLYILKGSTDFYHQLYVAWMNIKIVSAYMCLFLCIKLMYYTVDREIFILNKSYLFLYLFQSINYITEGIGVEERMICIFIYDNCLVFSLSE